MPILVKPIATLTTNWKAVQMAMPNLNCISVLKAIGVKETDPAALPLLLGNQRSLTDAQALRFTTLQFMAVVPQWDNQPMMLDALCMGETLDPETNQLHKIILLSGTADCWKVQIIEECQSADPIRRKVFNHCYDMIRHTALKQLFDQYTQETNRDGTFLLRRKC